MLVDIRTTEDYGHLHVEPIIRPFRDEREKKKIQADMRARMQNLYKNTAEKCGFTKTEGDANERYYVREFP